MSALPPFANEPMLELRRAPIRASLLDALRTLDARLPLHVPVLIAGEPNTAGAGELLSTDPGEPQRLVAP